MEEVNSISNLINRVFQNISPEDVEFSSNLSNAWKDTLFSIKSVKGDEGENLFYHSRIVDFKNGILLVEADHPGWIEILQMHKNYILTGLNKKTGDLKIQNIVYRLAGSKISLPKTPEDDKKRMEENYKKMEERFEKDEKAVKDKLSKGPQKHKNAELPPELNEMFENLKKNVLTNSKE